MQMNESEICKNYKEAKQKKEQIKILADLNCCSNHDIAMILDKHGLEVDKRYLYVGGTELKNKNPHPMKTSVSNVKPEIPKAEPEKETAQEKPEENAAPEIEPEPLPEVIPASVVELVENEIHNLHKINNDLLKRVQENIATLKELEGFLDSHKADE